MAVDIQENREIRDLTTFKVPVRARYFAEVKDQAELVQAITFAKSNGVAIFVLGGGSNTLFVKDFEGLVVRMAFRGISFSGEDVAKVHVAAGENWDDVVALAVSKGYFGIENLSYIPGSCGGAVVQNIGAYGAELSQVVESVDVFDTESFEMKKISNIDCKFGYRMSMFKVDSERRYMVTGTTLILKREGELNLSYKDVPAYFETEKIELSLKNMRKAIIDIRSRKLPDVKDVGTAGSFFKNPIVERLRYEELKHIFPEIPGTLISDGLVKLSAGWLLDHVGGFKGVRRNDAGVWGNQALVLVNYGTAAGSEILQLANDMQEKIKSKTGIELEREVVVA